MSESIKIMVVTHKAFDTSILPDEGYQPILVNALSDESKEFAKQHDWMVDSSGARNIAAENPFYCELTGHYWVWKNIATLQGYIAFL